MEATNHEESVVESVVVGLKEEDVASGASSPTTTMFTTIEQEEATTANEVNKKVFATEEQFRSVFSNTLVSSKPNLLLNIKN